jgi:hypothetical protein
LGDYVYQRQGVPFAGPDWHSGIWFDIGYGAMDHEVNFQGFTYAILGSRHWLDELYMQGNRSYGNLYTGPAIGRRDDNASGTSPYHYWGLSIICCQSRGSARALWDKILPAGLGGDNNIERTYFNDIITENTNYYLKAWLPFIDGPGNYNYENGLSFVNYGGESSQVQIFIASYNYMSAYIAQTYLHSPLGPAWLPSFQRYMEWACGNEVASTRMPVFYCIDYATSGSIKNTNAQIIYTPNVGQYYNATDASDMAGISPGDSTDLLAGGQWRQRGYSYRLTNGDKIRLAEAAANANNLSYNVDQLADGQFRSISGVSTIANPNDGFYVNCTSADHARWPTQCPVVGQPFTGYTRNGTAIVNEPGHAIAYRPQYDPGPGGGFADNNYAKYGKMIINGLKILGYDVHTSEQAMDLQAGGTPDAGQGVYGYEQWQWWDPTIVVPR